MTNNIKANVNVNLSLCFLSYFSLSSQSELSASEHETLTDLMQKLFPLLVEIWTEISPQCQHRVEDFTQAGKKTLNANQFRGIQIFIY